MLAEQLNISETGLPLQLVLYINSCSRYHALQQPVMAADQLWYLDNNLCTTEFPQIPQQLLVGTLI